MAAPLMPKATAVWLVENTSLTFDQIADFCQLHPLEIQAIADGEVATQMQGLDPVANGQTTAEEIERCQADPEARLKLSPQALPPQLVKHKGPRYTPISKRQDKPDAISFLLKSHPELSDAQIEIVRKKATLKSYKAGQIICDEHDRSEDVYLIRSGLVKRPLKRKPFQMPNL